MAYWKIAPHECIEFDYVVLPAETIEHHNEALEYAQDRMAEAIDNIIEGAGPFSVSVELVKGDMPMFGVEGMT